MKLSFILEFNYRFAGRHKHFVGPHPSITDFFIKKDAFTGSAILEEGYRAVVGEEDHPVRRRDGKLHVAGPRVPPLPSKRSAGASWKAYLHDHLTSRVTQVHILSNGTHYV